MKDLEKRLSIIEEKLGISKETPKLDVGVRFTIKNKKTIYTITSIYYDSFGIGWDGFIDMTTYDIIDVFKYFNEGDWELVK